MVQLSFDAAVLKSRDDWFEVVNGIPTGGINSVDCGNIALTFVLKNLMYAAEKRPSELRNVDRFVDDISGQGEGSCEMFEAWIKTMRDEMVVRYGLDITFEVKPITQFTQFLDILYRFEGGRLTTDLFRKPTDANRYLEYSSYHPPHTFRSIVYSQALRYRRVVNNEEILNLRFQELQEFFVRSSYPLDMVRGVIDEVKLKPRDLGYKTRTGTGQTTTPWILTYGAGYEAAKKKIHSLNDTLSNSRTWLNEDPETIPKFQVVTRRAPNLRDSLFKRKALALEPSGSASTVPCTAPGEKKRGAPCQTCKVCSNKSCVENNGTTVKAQGGNCKTKNLIYAATCQLCSKNKVYVGKTVTQLSHRVNGHRSHFYSLLEDGGSSSVDNVWDDESVLGAHLYFVHHKRVKSDFNNCYVFDIISQSNPDNLRKFEQFFINKLKSLYPFGLNQVNSISGS